MEFISEYGLFLLKAITVVASIIVVVLFVVASGMKNGAGAAKGKIKVTRLNDRFEDMAQSLREYVLEEKALKQLAKKTKKEQKVERKASAGLEDDETRKKRVYVLDFDGDIKASETEQLRQTVTAVLSLAKPKDEVVLTLESQGGMVHSYGLASSQLARITAKGIPLTVCVDKVAASGGYMMACVADKLLAAPFAIIGSIGVVAQIPNFHKVLKKNSVDYEMFTAGEYKRTVTMFGENTEKGREKFTRDLEDTHELFKDFIGAHRDSVNVEEVATGEIWFGTRALDKNLIDGISTSDEYLTGLYADADVISVEYELKKSLQEKLGMGMAKAFETTGIRLFSKLNNRYWAG